MFWLVAAVFVVLCANVSTRVMSHACHVVGVGDVCGVWWIGDMVVDGTNMVMLP